MSGARYAIGIDLGTSNCALAFAALDGPARGQLRDFPIPQLVALGQVADRALFPSCAYLPTDQEIALRGFDLPWKAEATLALGEFARRQGTRIPGRLVSSAKSWLCHPAVDRTAAILPWGAPAEIPKLTPVQASSLLLAQMVQAWNRAHPDAPAATQEVVITVPASFDEVARGLTANAARQAGLEHFTLLEEPQAAFYDFSARHRAGMENLLATVRLILVVDVGGGTSDFTLVQAAFTGAQAALRRIAVGDHLMLGGDNMDAAIAHDLEKQWTGKGRKLTAGQWSQLAQLAREAKETLLSEGSPDRVPVVLASEGSKLLGGTMKAEVQRETVERLILDGFFPFSQPSDLPAKGSKLAIQELGLPFVSDPAVTRQIAGFLHKHAPAGWAALGQPLAEGEVPPGLPRPDAILLNGGVFNSPRIAARLVEVLSSWWPNQPPLRVLDHDSLDLAVARGAAYYGLVRHGQGQKITGGTARAYYVEVAAKSGKQGVCLIPRGFEEGEKIQLKERAFQLMLGKPVQFPIYSTTAERVDRPGDLVAITDELQPMPPIQTVLKSGRERVEKIPVYLEAALTEIGTLELWCQAENGSDRWKLEFDLRSQGTASELGTTETLPTRAADARKFIELFYGSKPPVIDAALAKAAPKEAKHLWASLERHLGARETWRGVLLRDLATALLSGISRRRRTADHEKIFFQLLGYCLRPGFGFALDDWRCEQASKIYGEAIQFHKERPNWNEFWIFWRRIAGGLAPGRQIEFWEDLKPVLATRLRSTPQKNQPKRKGIQPEGLEEMVRACAAFEHLPVEEKAWLGEAILERILSGLGGPWTWSLARIGARAPLYGSAHAAVSPEQAAEWIEKLLSLAGQPPDGLAFALAHLARKTNDRARDLPDAVRARVAETLAQLNAPAAWQEMVLHAQILEASEQARAYGDSLPAGLHL